MAYSRGWTEKALQAIVELAKERPFITSDDLYEAIDELPPHCNMVGAAMNEASRLRLIRATGRIQPSMRSEAKGRNIQIWESPFFRGGPAEWNGENPQERLPV